MVKSASAAVVLALASVAATATAGAQMIPGARFGIAGGATMPTGEYHADDAGDGFNIGWQGMLLLEFRGPKKRVGLRVDVETGENAANDQLNADVSAATGGPVTAKMKMRGGNLDLVYSFGRSRRGGAAYLLGGVGSHRVTLSATSQGLTSDTSETKFAWNAGGGLTFPLGRMSAFVEARYFSVETSFDNSGKLPFVAVMGGLLFGGK